MYKDFRFKILLILLTVSKCLICNDVEISPSIQKPHQEEKKKNSKGLFKKRVNGIFCAIAGYLLYKLTVNEYHQLKKADMAGLTSTHILGFTSLSVSGPNRKNLHSLATLACATASANLFILAYEKLSKS